jgi:hypothetical protein
MGWRLLERDPLSGIERWFSYDPIAKKSSIKTLQNVDEILDWNKTLANHDGDGYSPSREWRRAASIPTVLIHKWLAEEGIDVFNDDHWPAVVKKLDSIEYQYLRTAPGRIGKRARHM